MYHITSPCPFVSDSFQPLLKKIRSHIPNASFGNVLQSSIPMEKGILRLGICNMWACQVSGTFPHTSIFKHFSTFFLSFPRRISQGDVEVSRCWQVFDIWNRDFSQHTWRSLGAFLHIIPFVCETERTVQASVWELELWNQTDLELNSCSVF